MEARYVKRATDREKAFKAYVGALAAGGVRLAELVRDGDDPGETMRQAARLLHLADIPAPENDILRAGERVEAIQAIWERSGAESFIAELENVADGT